MNKRNIKLSIVILIILIFSCQAGSLLDLLDDILTENESWEIISPAPNTLLNPGEECIISWKAVKGDSVTIDLFLHDQLIERIAQSAPNNSTGINTFNWKVKEDLKTSAGYSIKFTIQDHPSFEGDILSSEKFLIDGTNWDTLPPVNRDNALQASVSMAVGKSPLVSLIYTEGGVGYAHTELLKLSGGSWNKATIDSPHIKSHFLTTVEKNDQTPVILSQIINLVEDTHNYAIKSYNGTNWISLGQLTTGTDPSTYISICTDMALSNQDEPAVLLLAIPKALIPLTTIGYVPLYLFKWNSISGIFDNKGAVMEIGSLFLNEIFSNTTDTYFFPELYPVVEIYENGTPVVAMVNALMNTGASNEKRIHCYTLSSSGKRTWLGRTSVSDGIADSPSIAIAGSDIPVVIFRDMVHDGRAQVKRWSGSQWENLGHVEDFENQPFTFSNDTLPAIAIDREGRIIAAYATGVYRWDDSIKRWECLGFPNAPGFSGKKTKKWLAVSDEAIAVCYITGEEPDKVQVKVLEY